MKLHENTSYRATFPQILSDLHNKTETDPTQGWVGNPLTPPGACESTLFNHLNVIWNSAKENIVCNFWSPKIKTFVPQSTEHQGPCWNAENNNKNKFNSNFTKYFWIWPQTLSKSLKDWLTDLCSVGSSHRRQKSMKVLWRKRSSVARCCK